MKNVKMNMKNIFTLYSELKINSAGSNVFRKTFVLMLLHLITLSNVTQTKAAVSPLQNWSLVYTRPVNTGGASITNTVSYPISNGPNRLLVVAISAGLPNTTLTGTTIPSVTWGGKTLTASTANSLTANRSWAFIYYLKEADIATATGSNLIVNMGTATWAGYVTFAAVYQDVDQTTSVRMPAAVNLSGTAGATASTATAFTAGDQGIFVTGWSVNGGTSSVSYSSVAANWSGSSSLFGGGVSTSGGGVGPYFGGVATRTITTAAASETVSMTVSIATYRPSISIISLVPAPLFFRSITSGNWSSTSTWEQSADGITYSAATSTPTSIDNVIIQNGHTVTLISASAANTATVKGGGTLALSTFGLTASSVSMDCGATSAATISGTGTLTLGGNISVTDATTSTAGAVISCPVALGANRVITVADDGTSASDLTISGIISGAFSVTKDGAGTLLLSGANTYSSTTTISAGILQLGASSTVNTSSPTGTTGVITVANGATLDMNGFSYTSGHTQALTINGTGVSGLGAISNSSSTASTLIGPITFATAASIEGEGGLLNITGTPVSGTTAITLGGAAGGSITTIIAGARNLIKENAGTWTLSGLNTYTGTTTVSGGILRAQTNNVTASANGAFGNHASGLNLNGGTIQSNVATFSRPITVTATNSGLDAFGSARDISSTITLATAGTFNLNVGANTVASAEGQNLTLSGVISNSSGTLGLTKIGTSTAILSASNSYAGTTDISAGTLRLGATGTAPNSPLGTTAAGTTVASGAVLDLNGFILATAEPLNLNGTGLTASPAGALTNTGGNTSYSGSITLQSASTITATSSGTLTCNGNIGGAFGLTLDGAGTGTLSGIISTPTSLSKNGAGTWILSGLNTYTGATNINAGTLRAGVATTTANGAFGNASAITLANTAGAILDVNGFNNTIGSITGGGATGGNVSLAAAILTIGADNTSPAEYAGIISGSGGITKTGTGSLILSGNNSFSGATTISNGYLRIRNGNALGTSAGSTTVQSGARLELEGGITVSSEPLTIAGSGPNGNAAIDNISENNNWNGNITLSDNAYMRNLSGIFTVNGNINLSSFYLTLGGPSTTSVINGIVSGSGNINKVNTTGFWTLAGNNTYSGGTSLNAGGLNINHGGALGSGGLICQTSASVSIDNTSGAAITLSSNPTLTLNADLVFVGTNNLNMGTGDIFMAADRSITCNGSSTLTLGGALSASSFSLTKNGTGGLSFGSNAISLNGLTIGGGTFTSASGTLSLAGNLSNSGSFAHNSGTVNLTGGNQSLSGTIPFNNLGLSGTGTKTIGASVTIINNLSISGVVASLNAGTNYTVNTLTLNSKGTASGTWGSTSSSATNKDNTFFAATTGMVSVSTDTRPVLTITATGTSKTYGTALSAGASASNFTVTGSLLPGEAITSVTLTPNAAGLSATTAAGTAYSIMPSAATGTGGFNANNYNITYVAFNGTVSTKTLTLTSVAASNKTYDRNTSATITATLNGVVGTDDVSLSGTGTFATASVGTGISVTSTATLTGTTAANYTFTQPTGLSANITQKALTISGAAASNKSYDGTTSAVITGSLSGVINPDVVTLNGTGTFATSTVGNGISVTSTSTLSGADAANYSLTQPTGLSANITPPAITITATGPAKTYGTGLSTGASASNFTVTGTLLPGEAITSVTLTPDAAGLSASTPAGTAYSVTPSAATGTGGFDANNYNITYVAYNGTVATKTLTLSSAAASNKTYNGNTTATITGTLSGVVGADDVSLSGTGTFADANVGTSKVVTSTATLTGTAAANYTLTQPTGLTANITVASLTVTASNQSKTYGATTPTSGTLNTNFTVSGLLGTDAASGATLGYSGTPAGNTSTASVGTYTITPSALTLSSGSTSNYSITYSTGTLTVNAAAITVNASNQNKTFGGTAPTSGTLNTNFTVTGLQGTDAASGATLGYSGTPAGNLATAAVGTYTITPSALTLSSGSTTNYSITYSTGTLTVNAAALTVTASNQSKTFGGTAPTSGTLNTNFTVSGLLGTDAANGATLGYSGTPAGNLATAAVGTYTITPSALTLSSGSTTNYSITYSTGTLTVNAATLTVTASNQSKTFGATAPTSGTLNTNFTVSGLLGTDAASGATLGYSGTPAGNLATAAVGTYTINPSALTLSSGSTSNYSITYNTGTLTVNTAALTVTASNQSKTFGGTAPTSGTLNTNYTVSGLQGTDAASGATLGYSGTPAGNTSTAAVGTYTITPSALTLSSGSTSNYSITYSTGTLTVNAASLTVTASNQSKTFGGTAPTSGTLNTNFTVSGLLGTDAASGATLGYSGTPAGNTATAAVGTYTITPSALTLSAGSLSNYSVTYNTGTLTVNAAAVTVTASNQSKTFGGTAPTSGTLNTTFTVSGLLGTDAASGATLGYSGTPAGNLATAAVGTYTITPSALTLSSGSTSNYSITYSTGTLTVNAAAVTVTASNQSKTFGGTAPTSGTLNTNFTVSGLLGTDAASGATLGYSGTPAGNTSTAAVGTYTITPSALTLSSGSTSNYSITYSTGTLTVNAAALTVTASAQSKTYGATAPTSGTLNTNFTVSGLLGTDAASGATLGYSGTPAGNTSTAAVGTYTITPSALTLSSGSTSNYSITYSTGTLTVNAAAVTVTASTQSKTYGATAPTSGTTPTHFSISGLQGTDAASGVTLSYSGSPAGNLGTAGVGTYTITPSALTLSSGSTSNYSITYNTGTLTVNAATLTITGITANNKVYDGLTDATITGTPAYSGLQNGESFAVSGTPIATFVNANAGTGKSVTIIGYTTPSSNYSVSQPTLTADINAVALTITADNVYKATGSTLTSPATGIVDFSSSGLVNNETIGSVTMTYGTGAASGAAAGTYVGTATPSAATGGTFNASNYSVTYVSGNIIVGSFRYAVATGNWNATSTWSATSGGTAGASVPTSSDFVKIGEAATAWTVTIPTGYAATCANLEIGNNANSVAQNLNFTSNTSTLTVNNDITMYAGSAGSTRTIAVGAGTLDVGSDITFINAAATTTNTNRIAQITISTGTVNTGGNIIYNSVNANVAGASVNQKIVFSGAGNLNIGGNILFQGAVMSLGTLTPSTGTVNFNGTSAITVPIGVSSVTYNNLRINNIGGATLSAATTATNVTGNISVESGTLNNGGFAMTLASTKSLSVSNGATLNLSGTSTMPTVSGAGATKTFGTTSIVNYSGTAQTVTAETYGDLILSGSGTKTMPASTITVADDFTTSGTISATAGAAINVTRNVTIGSGTTLGLGSFTHTIGGNWTNNGGTVTPSTSTLVFNNTSSAQAINGTAGTRTFNNITIAKSSQTLSIGGNATTVNISGNLTITSGTFDNGVASNINMTAGNWTNNGGTFTAGSGTVTFSGSAAQNINGTSATTFNNLTINNVAGVSLNGSTDATISGTLTFTAGRITTNANRLITSASSTISGAGAGKYVFGNLRRFIANTSAPTVVFEIGDATNYTPATLAFAGTTSGSGYLDASISTGVPAVASGLSQSKYVNRQWTLTNTGVTGFTSYSPTFTFVAGDLVGSPSTSALIIRRNESSTWNTTTTGTQAATSTQATGLTSFGLFAVGETAGAPVVTTTPSAASTCNGSDATFTAASTSLPAPTIQWQRSTNGTTWTNITASLDAGTTYSGFTTGTLSLTGSASGLNSYQYRAVFTNINGSTNSSGAALTIRALPTLSSTLTPSTICTGTAFTYTPTSATAGATFTWTRAAVTGISNAAITTPQSSNPNEVLTNALGGTINVIYAYSINGNGCSNNQNVTVGVRGLPSTPGSFTTSSASVCREQSAVVYTVPNNAGVTYNWTYGGTGASFSSTTNSVSVNFNSTATSGNISVAAQNACGTSSARTLAVTVNTLPTVTITPNYCTGTGYVTLTSSAGSSYLWSTGETTASISVNQAGSYSVTVTNANNCSKTQSQNVAQELSTNGNFNSGNSGFTSAYGFNNAANGLASAGTYAIGTNANNSNSSFYGTDHGSGTGNFMIVNGSTTAGTAVWTQTDISVQPNTTYYFSAWGLSLSNSDNAQLQFKVNGQQVGSVGYLSNGYTNTAGPFSWTRFYGSWNSGASTTATVSIINLNGADAGNDFGLDDISFGTLAPVALSASPLANAGAGVCVNGSVILSANGNGGSSPYTYAWTGPNAYTSSQANPTLSSNATSALDGTYSVTITDGFGCTATESLTLSVNPLPVNKTISALSSTICSGTSTSIRVTSSEAGIYYQLRNNSNNAAIGNPVYGDGGNIDLSTGNLDATTTFNVLATSYASSCDRQLSATVTVTVTPTPVLQITNQAACSGTVNLTAPAVTAGSTGGGTLTYWTNAAATTSMSSPTTAGNGTYYIKSTFNGCFDIEPVVVSISSNPSTSFSYSGSPFCSTGNDPSPVFSGSVAGTFTSSPAGLVFTAASTGQIDLSASNGGTYTITNTITPAGGCGTFSSNTSVTITTAPVADFSYNSNDLCKSANASNPAPIFSNGGVAGTFASSNGLSLNTSTGAINIVSSLPGNYAITNTVAGSGGCSAVVDTFFIDINPYTFDGSVSSTVTSNTICSGESTQLIATGSSYLSSVLSEKFNGTISNWTVTNNSSGGAVANASWLARPDAYNNTVSTFNSNDNSQFYLSDSYNQNGSVTSTILRSPVMNTVGYSTLSLSFFHHYDFHAQASESAKVEVSTNGFTWTTVQTYTSDQGAANSFANPSINLNAYVGNPTFYVRFNYYAGGRARSWAIDNVTVSGNSTKYNYAWTSSPSGLNTSTQSPSVSPTTNTFYILTATNVYGCSTPVSPVPVTVKSVPALTSTLNPSGICSNSLFSYTPSSSMEGSTITWTRAAVGGISNAAITSPQSSNPSETLVNTTGSPIDVVYAYTSTNNGCSKNENVTVTVNPKPVISVTTSHTICRDSSANLNAGVSNAIAPVTYAWSPATDLSNSTIANPSANLTVSSRTYTLTATDANGCSTTSESVTVNKVGLNGTEGLFSGTNSSNWNSCFNWSDGRIPTSLTNVVIDQTFNGDVEITGLAYCNNLQVLSTSNIAPDLLIKTGGSLIASGNVSISKSSGQNTSRIVLSGNGQFSCQNLTISGRTAAGQDAQFVCANDSSTITINGDVQVNTGGVISISNADINLKGDMINHGRSQDYFGGTATIILSGNTLQEITCPDTQSIGSLVINNSASGAAVRLNSNLAVLNNLTLTSGKIDLNGKDLILGVNGSYATITGGNSSSYAITWDGAANGNIVHRTGVAGRSYLFPTGDLDNYTPISVNLASAQNLSQAHITTTMKGIAHPNRIETGAYLNRYWTVEPTGLANPVYSIEYTYASGDVTGDPATLYPVKISQGQWMTPGNNPRKTITKVGEGSINTNQRKFSWSNITSFSDFSGSGDGNALPVELLEFRAEVKEDAVELNWSTASEINNDFFTVERSSDAVNFEPIAEVDGAGNSTMIKSYSALDNNPLSGVSYYRLKQTDYNGEFEYSHIVPVHFNNGGKLPLQEFVVKPENNSISFRFINESDENVSISLFDASGRSVYTSGKLSAARNWASSITIENMQRGVYFANFHIGGRLITRKFLY